MEKSTKILILVAIIVVVIIVVIVIVVVVSNKKKSDGTTDDSPTEPAVEPYRSTETFYHTNATDKFQAFIDSYIKGEQGIF